MTPHDLLKHLDVIAEAPNGIARLRELVLQLAVRGKLVPQHPEDEPAEALLARIEAGRARLLQAGKIPARTPEGRPSASPFDLPHGWAWCRAGDVLAFVTSGSRGWAQFYSETGALFLRIGNLDYETTKLDLQDVQRVRPPENAEGRRTAVLAGDILISITGDTGMVGLVPDGLGEAYINQHIAMCRPLPGVVPSFLATLCTSLHVRDQLTGRERGMKNSLGLDDIRTLQIPLPPAREQERIVARVDELMALLDRLEAARDTREATRRALRDSSLAALRDAGTPNDLESAWQRVADHMDDLFTTPEDLRPFRQAILQLAVRGRLALQDPADEPAAAHEEYLPTSRVPSRGRSGQRSAPNSAALSRAEPFRLPSNWRWVALEALLVDGPTNGWSPKAVEMETSTRTLKLSATTKGFFDASQYKFVDATLGPDSPLWLRSGDLLIQRSNTPEYVGAAAVYDGPDRTFIYPDLMMRCRLRDDVSLAWVHKALLAPFSRQWFTDNASGTSDSMVKLNQATVRATRVPLPPPAEQQRLVARLADVMGRVDGLEGRLVVVAATHETLAAAALERVGG